jgi:hypothetical protein
MTPTDPLAYRLLNDRYENASTPQDREAAARGMLLHRLQSGLSHFEVLRRAENCAERKAHLTQMGFEFPLTETQP